MITPAFYPWHYGLEDYKKLRYVKFTICNFFKNIREVGYWLKNIVDRGLHGYCQRDTWSFDYYLADVIIGGSKILKETKHGYPCDCDPFDSTNECKCEAKWDKELDEMIEGFEAAKRVLDLDYESESFIKDIEADIKLFNEKMKVFADGFFSLWD